MGDTYGAEEHEGIWYPVINGKRIDLARNIRRGAELAAILLAEGERETRRRASRTAAREWREFGQRTGIGGGRASRCFIGKLGHEWIAWGPYNTWLRCFWTHSEAIAYADRRVRQEQR